MSPPTPLGYFLYNKSEVSGGMVRLVTYEGCRHCSRPRQQLPPKQRGLGHGMKPTHLSEKASPRRLSCRAVVDRPDVEADVRYNRADMSSLHAYSARWHFVGNIAKGEPGMRLAEAALLVAAEDDAIGECAPCALPRVSCHATAICWAIPQSESSF